MKSVFLNSIELEFTRKNVDADSMSYLSKVFSTKDPTLVVVNDTFLEEDIKKLTLIDYRSNEIKDSENQKQLLDLILTRTLESYHNSTMYVICQRLKEHSLVFKEISNSKGLGKCSIKLTKSKDIDISIQICNEMFCFKLPPHTPDSVSVGMVSVLINLLKKEK